MREVYFTHGYRVGGSTRNVLSTGVAEPRAFASYRAPRGLWSRTEILAPGVEVRDVKGLEVSTELGQVIPPAGRRLVHLPELS